MCRAVMTVESFVQMSSLPVFLSLFRFVGS